jgi:tryptophan 2,3-dioxygenase
MSHTGPILEGRGATDYERYIRTDELLALQKPRHELVNPEESLFQTMHQTAELWLKEIDLSVDRVAEAVQAAGEGSLHHAADLLFRCERLLHLLREQIEILETMDPADYHVIRVSSLGRGSGQESPGFNRLLDVGERLWPPVARTLDGAGLTALDVEKAPKEHYALHRLIQGLLGYDEAFMKWRYVHMRLAMRIIGSRVKSLKGVPVAQLEIGTREPLFPDLWDTISDLTDVFRPEY